MNTRRSGHHRQRLQSCPEGHLGSTTHLQGLALRHRLEGAHSAVVFRDSALSPLPSGWVATSCCGTKNAHDEPATNINDKSPISHEKFCASPGYKLLSSLAQGLQLDICLTLHQPIERHYTVSRMCIKEQRGLKVLCEDYKNKRRGDGRVDIPQDQRESEQAHREVTPRRHTETRRPQSGGCQLHVEAGASESSMNIEAVRPLHTAIAHDTLPPHSFI